MIREALRELWWWLATRDFELTVRHKPGLEMTIPDMLSRAHNDVVGNKKFREFKEKTTEKEIQLESRSLMPTMPL